MQQFEVIMIKNKIINLQTKRLWFLTGSVLASQFITVTEPAEYLMQLEDDVFTSTFIIQCSEIGKF